MRLWLFARLCAEKCDERSSAFQKNEQNFEIFRRIASENHIKNKRNNLHFKYKFRDLFVKNGQKLPQLTIYKQYISVKLHKKAMPKLLSFTKFQIYGHKMK